jgi:hypothetical protein
MKKVNIQTKFSIDKLLLLVNIVSIALIILIGVIFYFEITKPKYYTDVTNVSNSKLYSSLKMITMQDLIVSTSSFSNDIEFVEIDGIDYFKMNFINENGTYTFNGLPKTFATSEEIDNYKIKNGDFFMNEDCIITNPIDDDACIIMDDLDSIKMESSYTEPSNDEN